MGGESLQRPALAQRIGLSRMAVSELLADLEARGIVTVEGALGGAPGRSQLTYALKSDAALTIGFDIGGTKIAAAIADLRGDVLAETSAPTFSGGLDGLMAQIGKIAEQLCEAANVSRYRVRTAAMGVPAVVDPHSDTLSLAGNLKSLEGSNMREAFSQTLGVEVLIDNDINLALLAEARHGAANGYENVFFVGLGTGVGGALMVNGNLLRGRHGGAGEIGYMPLWRIEAAGVAALEEHVGEAGIRRAYVAAGGDPGHSVRDIFTASGNGDVRASEALDKIATEIARAVLVVFSLVDPDLVVFGGSIGSQIEFVSRVEKQVTAAWSRPIKIVRSSSGGRAGLLGALELARAHLLNEMFGTQPPG